MNLKQLNYFLVLEETGSVTLAAKQLGISRTALNNYLNKLESRAGASLLERSRTGIRLTPAGEVFLRHARTIRDYYREMTEKESTSSAPVLRLGVTPHRGASFAGSIWKDMKEHFPELRIETTEGYSRELAAQTARGETDLCLVSLRHIPKALHALLLQTEDLFLVVPEAFTSSVSEYLTDLPAHPASFPRSSDGSSENLFQVPEADPAILEHLPLAFQDETSALGNTVLSFLKEKHINPPDVLTNPNLRVVSSLITAGQYAGILPPAHIIPRLRRCCVRVRGLDALRFYAAVPAGHQLTKAERYLVYLHIKSRNAFEDSYCEEVREIIQEFRGEMQET